FSRAAAANADDIALIGRCAKKAVECAMQGIGGVVGEDEDQNNELRAIEFERIAGGKPFDINVDWFGDLLSQMGQPKGEVLETSH
ncbi:MAG: pyrophosphate--fructose-6-phosphate 1-phosphotransferase, partial [Rhodopirellula sp.]|nr:pyrophosphate--fructose-6-phosphate 1-phosphotransferase [Rhodopirellula sp.]